MKTAKPKPKTVKHLYEFGPFRLDGTERLLLREGAPLPLTGKAFDTLLVLVQHSGHLIEKDELMKTVWPDAIVEENNLTQSVSALRKALGPEHTYIETVPRQGYRFVALVKEREEEIPGLIVRERTRSTVTIEEEIGSEEAAAVPGRAPEKETAKRKALFLVAGAGLALALIAATVSMIRPSRSPAGSPASPAQRLNIPPLAQGEYVTVLPFRTLGTQESLRYVAEGLDEALSAKLFQLSGLHVVSAATGAKAGREKPLETVGSELGVNLAVAGVVQEAGDQIQVIVSLEDIAGKRKLWTQDFSAPRQDLLAVEDRIFAGLIVALKLQPGSDELARGNLHPTENGDAYDLYLRGRDAIRGYKDAKDIATAMGFYDRALNKDPKFALAYAGLADASLEMYGQKKENFWSEKALHAAQQALRLGGNLAEVHLALGSVHYSMGKPDQAVAELRRALELQPNSDEGYRRLGSAYLAKGQKEEAMRAYQRAIQLSPYYSANYQMLGDAYLDLGDNVKALEAFRRITELEPGSAEGYEDLGAVYFREGKWQESIPAFQKALALQPYAPTYSNLGSTYFYLKRYDEAAKMFEKAVEMNPNEEVAVGNLADAYRWSGQKQRALSTYDAAIGLGYKELQVNPRDPSVLGSLALYYAKKGDVTKALGFVRRARSVDPNRVDLVYIQAVVETLASQPSEALRTLREAFERGYAPEEARSDPELASLQGRPEFARLMERFGKKLN